MSTHHTPGAGVLETEHLISKVGTQTSHLKFSFSSVAGSGGVNSSLRTASWCSEVGWGGGGQG